MPNNLDVPAVPRRSGVGYEYAVKRQVLQDNSEALSQCTSQRCCGMRHRNKFFHPTLRPNLAKRRRTTIPQRVSRRVRRCASYMPVTVLCRVVQGLTRVWRLDAGGSAAALPANVLRVPQCAGRDQHLIAAMVLDFWF